MTDNPENQTTDDAPEAENLPALFVAHKHVAHIGWLMAECDRRRVAHLEDGKPRVEKDGSLVKPELLPYRALHDYLAENEVIKSFPSSNGKEQYVFTKPEDFEDMIQVDWWRMIRSLQRALMGVEVAAQKAKK